MSPLPLRTRRRTHARHRQATPEQPNRWWHLGGNPQRGGVAVGIGGPPVTALPDTAMSAASTSGLLMAGVVVLSGTTLVAVTVRRNRSRR